MKLTATSCGAEAEQTQSFFSGLNVQTAPVYVGDGEYEELEAEDSVNITIGIFMDGTLNNRKNTKARQAYDKANKNPSDKNSDAQQYKNTLTEQNKQGTASSTLGSYRNDLSNVARIEPVYPEVSSGKNLKTKIYIEGIGTTDLGLDDKEGMGKGEGSTGIPAKVERAIEMAVESIVTLLDKNDIEQINILTFDVFGFSRGAAAARHFVTKLSGNIYSTPNRRAGRVRSQLVSRFGALGEALKKEGIEQPKYVKAGFAGLYDTVASYGIEHVRDTEQLGLDAVGRANYVFQLVAQDEHRENFVITNINSAGPKGVERLIPGVHSDIGGGYTDDYLENNLVIREGGYTVSSKKSAKLRKQLINESWYRPDEIFVDEDNGDAVVVNKTVTSKKYSFVSLHILAEYANTKKIDFEISKLQKKYALNESISISLKDNTTYKTDLKAIKNRLNKYIYDESKILDFNDPEDQKMIRAIRINYVHTSAHYNNKIRIFGVLYAPHHPRNNYFNRQREENRG